MRKITVFLIALILFQNCYAQKKYYSNPILAGFYPDPSICKVGDDYYLVNSSFAYYPGLPLFHSKDLVNWKQIGYAMNRPGQLNLTGAGVSRGLFAPTIRYYKGLFYIVCTLIDKGGNFVITAKDPAGPWSDPTWLKEVNGIDPSLFFNENDSAYIIYNSNPPDNKSLYNGHRTIRMRSFDYINLKVGDDEKIIVNGGTDISKKPIWIEGPHIYKINGWYYLMCAEGGTGYDHSEVIFRSKEVWGPYVSYENNPILTQRTLDTTRKNPITSTGHADLVETNEGNWYAVFLGCRPYEDDYYNTGRETFMAPVKWKDGWPIINPDFKEVQYRYPLPMASAKNVTNSFGGNAFYHDDFNPSELNYRWQFLRTMNEKWYSLNDKKGFLTIDLRPETCNKRVNPAFIAHRQQNLSCEATTSLQFSATSENEKAGLVIFQNETHYYYLCKSVENNEPVIQLYKSKADTIELITKLVLLRSDKEVQLKIKADRNSYSFYFSTDNKNWTPLKDNVDGKFLSTKVAGGFVGSMFALYATTLGKESKSKAYFDWFEYKGQDEVYEWSN